MQRVSHRTGFRPRPEAASAFLPRKQQRPLKHDDRAEFPFSAPFSDAEAGERERFRATETRVGLRRYTDAQSSGAPLCASGNLKPGPGFSPLREGAGEPGFALAGWPGGGISECERRGGVLAAIANNRNRRPLWAHLAAAAGGTTRRPTAVGALMKACGHALASGSVFRSARVGGGLAPSAVEGKNVIGERFVRTLIPVLRGWLSAMKSTPMNCDWIRGAVATSA